MALRLNIEKSKCTVLRRKRTCKKDPKDGLYPCQKVCQERGVSLIVETVEKEPYACMQCRYDPSMLSPPCMFTERRKNASFVGLLNSKLTGIREPAPLCPINAIKISEKGVWIDADECVGCLLCAAACPISAIVLDHDLRAHLLSPHNALQAYQNACPWGAISFKQTSSVDVAEFKRFERLRSKVRCDNAEVVSQLENMEFEKIQHPTCSFVGPLGVRKTNFEDFTRTDEVTKLTPWLGEALKRISQAKVRSAYEVRLPSKPGFRYPRLDFCIADSKAVLVVESKRDERLARVGIVDQIRKKYREEIKEILSGRQIDTWNVILAIGGFEKDISRSTYLFALLDKNRIQLVSASLIWCLLAYNFFTGEELPWSKVIPQIFSNQNVISALAQGVIVSNGAGGFVKILIKDFLKVEDSIITH